MTPNPPQQRRRLSGNRTRIVGSVLGIATGLAILYNTDPLNHPLPAPISTDAVQRHGDISRTLQSPLSLNHLTKNMPDLPLPYKGFNPENLPETYTELVPYAQQLREEQSRIESRPTFKEEKAYHLTQMASHALAEQDRIIKFWSLIGLGSLLVGGCLFPLAIGISNRISRDLYRPLDERVQETEAKA